MGGSTLAAALNGTGLDVLFAIVPGTACVAGEDGQHDGADGGADEQASDKLRAEEETAADRHDDSQQRRNLHFADSTLGGNLNTGLVVGLLLAGEDAGNLAELAADLVDHFSGCLGDGFNKHA